MKGARKSNTLQEIQHITARNEMLVNRKNNDCKRLWQFIHNLETAICLYVKHFMCYDTLC